MTEVGMKASHKVVSHEAWLAARRAFLTKEKEFTRTRDELSRLRRELPWEKVEKDYVFEGAVGQVELADLFMGKHQLIVYHFMLGPDWEAGCKSCSFWADNFDGIDIHLAHRDTTLVAVSRAPYAKLDAYKRRMGWSFAWYSSFGGDFNFDYRVSFTSEEIAAKTADYNFEMRQNTMSELPGISVFYRDDDGSIYHTYSCYSRGVDMMNGAYHHLDLTPKGRDEAGLPHTMAWVRRHDEYES
jgi:predicted dithiol-disulfide oxidoreductase (DUF899 family)